MQRPVPKHEARIFIGAMTVDAPGYSVEQAVEAAKQIEAAEDAQAQRLDPASIWSRNNKHT